MLIPIAQRNIQQQIECPVWKELDDCRTFISYNDKIFYAHEYTKYSNVPDDNKLLRATSSMICNFKMDITITDSARLKHKSIAIERFIEDLLQFNFEAPFVFIPALTSETESSDRFNPRLKEVVYQMANRFMKQYNKKVYVENPIIRINGGIPLHKMNPKERDPNKIITDFKYQGFSKEFYDELQVDEKTKIYLIDDVITKGTSFAAYKKFLQTNCMFNFELIGLCWGKYI